MVDWKHKGSEILHKHPFDPFIRNNSKFILIGTFPGRKFTHPKYKLQKDDWYYGTSNNLFWNLISYALTDNLKSQTPISKTQKIKLLENNDFGICDIVYKANRIRDNNTDINLYVSSVFDLSRLIQSNQNIKTIFLTSKSMFKEFFIPVYIIDRDDFTLQNTFSKTIRNVKIDSYIYKFQKSHRTIKVIPLNSPARDIPPFDIKKEIYKEVIQNEMRQ